MSENIKSVTIKNHRNGSEFTIVNDHSDDNFIDLIVNKLDGTKEHFFVQMPNLLRSIADPIMDLKFSSRLYPVQK
jgi:hypothetical protein